MVEGVIGMDYHCPIDGGTYRIVGPHTVVRVTDPAAIRAASETHISNWRNFYIQGDDRPAGEVAPPPFAVFQSPPQVRFSGPPDMGSGHSFTRRELVDHFVSRGFSLAGAIGIVANLEAETASER